MRSVLILAYSWPPDGQVGAVRPVYLARQLARNGWQPVVVTVRERYYEMRNTAGIAGADSAIVIRTRRVPHPRVAYLWLKSVFVGWRRRLLGNNAVSAQPSKGSPPDTGRASRGTSGAVKRTLLSLFYTPDEFLGWFPFALAASIRAVLRYRPRCVISTGPPFTSHLIALALKGLTGRKWVADFRDPWSWREELPTGASSTVSDRVNRGLEAMAIRFADRVVCVTPSTTERYRQVYPRVPSAKWVTITNGYDLAEFSSLGTVESQERFTITYVGGFDFSRTPLPVLRAVGELVAEGKLDKNHVGMRFVGPCHYAGNRSMEQMIAENGLSGIVEIIGFVPRPDALKEMLRASILMLLGGTQRLSVAAKVYEYLASRTPILAIVDEGDTADIIRRTGAGRVISPGDLKGAKDAILSFYEKFRLKQLGQDLGSRRSPEAVADYDWETLGKRYATVLEECCNVT